MSSSRPIQTTHIFYFFIFSIVFIHVGKFSFVINIFCLIGIFHSFKDFHFIKFWILKLFVCKQVYKRKVQFFQLFVDKHFCRREILVFRIIHWQTPSYIFWGDFPSYTLVNNFTSKNLSKFASYSLTNNLMNTFF